MDREPMTRKGYEALIEKLRMMKEVEQPKIQKAIGEALDHGDISENSELDAAREEDARLSGRIAELESRLSRADIVEIEQMPQDMIAIGAKITLEDLDRGGSFDYLLVGEGETRDDVDTVSVTSPLGQSLIGKKSGEEVQFNGPRGTKRYKVLSYLYE